jgi:hypothetical protein
MHLKGLGIFLFGGREGVLGSFGFLLFTICSQWISNMFPKFTIAHDFHLTSFFFGKVGGLGFFGVFVVQNVFPLCFQ